MTEGAFIVALGLLLALALCTRHNGWALIIVIILVIEVIALGGAGAHAATAILTGVKDFFNWISDLINRLAHH